MNCLEKGPRERWAGTVGGLQELRASVFQVKELNSARDHVGQRRTPSSRKENYWPLDFAICDTLSREPSWAVPGLLTHGHCDVMNGCWWRHSVHSHLSAAVKTDPHSCPDYNTNRGRNGPISLPNWCALKVGVHIAFSFSSLPTLSTACPFLGTTPGCIVEHLNKQSPVAQCLYLNPRSITYKLHDFKWIS